MPDLPEQRDRAARKGAEALRTLKEFDQRRPGFPGEHLLVLAAGAYLLTTAGKRRSMGSRLLRSFVGSALLARAASGRGGVARLARMLR